MPVIANYRLGRIFVILILAATSSHYNVFGGWSEYELFFRARRVLIDLERPKRGPLEINSGSAKPSELLREHFRDERFQKRERQAGKVIERKREIDVQAGDLSKDLEDSANCSAVAKDFKPQGGLVIDSKKLILTIRASGASVVSTLLPSKQYFNPSAALVNNGSKFVLVFRAPQKGDTNIRAYDHIGFYELNKKTLRVASPLRFLEYEESRVSEAERGAVSVSSNSRGANKQDGEEVDSHFVHGEDSRLFTFNNRLFITFNGINRNASESRFISFGEVISWDSRDAVPRLKYPVFILNSSEISGVKKHQKNWTPFQYKNKLLWTYSIIPHRIVVAIADGHASPPYDVVLEQSKLSGSSTPERSVEAKVRIVAETTISNSTWRFGPLRGGTSPVLLNETTYIAFFHSSTEYLCKGLSGIITYVMGAYLFSSEPPFNIIAISRRPIVGPNQGFYTGSWVNKRVSFVIFPGSIHVSNDVITVFYGRQDRESWVARLNRTVMLSNMVHVDSKTVLNDHKYWSQ